MRLWTVKFGRPSYKFTINISTNLISGLTVLTPPEISSSLLHVDFGVYCLRRKLTLKRRLTRSVHQALQEKIMKPGTSQDTWWTWLQMGQGPKHLRTGASEDRWMVAPGCDEWLTTWCGLTLGRVLQVHVAAWFALVQVKSGRERSMPCGASEEWRDK
jgi:hypothetical protein